MNERRVRNVIKAAKDKDGWISTKKGWYVRMPVENEAEASNNFILPPYMSIIKKEIATSVNKLQGDSSSSASITPLRTVHGDFSSSASVTPDKTVSYPKQDIKKEETFVTPQKSMRVKNPYKTQSKSYSSPQSVTTTKPKEEKEYKVSVGSTYGDIKRSHKLYFTYDPRGYKTQPLPKGYCEFCRCPMNYCAEIVFGVMSKDHALTKVYTPGTYHDKDDRGVMKQVFDEAYTEAVFSKLRWNGFNLNAIEVEESWRKVKIPLCMKKKV